MYKIDLNKSEGKLFITLSGTANENELKVYLDELKNTIKAIIPTQYIVSVDASNVATGAQQLIGYIEESMKIVATTPFRKRYSIMPQSAIATLQVKRLGKSVGIFNDMIIVNTLSEVV